MESFEFLGGRYNRPEQIMSGPMQAFRAQNAATGRTVFIHRVSTTEASEQQATLLKLLTTALVKSKDAKRLVLDFGEERGYWYVVTESEPQCALLREWLQLEIDAAASVHPGAPEKPVATPPTLPQPPTDPGEFTRFLSGRPQSPITQRAMTPPPPSTPVPESRPEPSVGEFTRVFQSPANNPPPPSIPSALSPAPPAPAGPGEFTSFFNAAGTERPNVSPASTGPVQRPASPPPLPPTPPSPPESGEFTRFFQGGLPPSSPKPPGPVPLPNLTERPRNSPFVQRPNTPVPPPPQPSAPAKPVENGEFTQLFSRPADAPPVMRPNFTKDIMGQPTDRTDELFSQRIEIPSPSPSSQPAQGEFTRMFGAGGSAVPALPVPSVVASPRQKSPLDDDPHLTQPVAPAMPQTPAAPAATASASGAPGEFTRIMQGVPKPAVAASPIPKLPTPAALPLPIKPPAPKNKKLLIFLSILGVLAALLIVLMSLLMKK